MDAGVVFFILIGVACLVLGVAFRAEALSSRDRPWYGRYRSRGGSNFFRNGPFALIPFGLAIILGGLALPLLDVSRRTGMAVMIVALVFTAVGTAIGMRPPSWSKPAWLRYEERTR